MLPLWDCALSSTSQQNRILSQRFQLNSEDSPARKKGLGSQSGCANQLTLPIK